MNYWYIGLYNIKLICSFIWDKKFRKCMYIYIRVKMLCYVEVVFIYCMLLKMVLLLLFFIVVFDLIFKFGFFSLLIWL